MISACFGCSDSETEEHLEHVIPAHKPKNFAEAVSELNSREAAFFDGSASDEMKQEMIDIIVWLPELAADSDLRRDNWETVQKTSQELSKIAASPSSEQPPESWNSHLDELEAIVPFSDLSHPGANPQQVEDSQTSEPTVAGEQQNG